MRLERFAADRSDRRDHRARDAAAEGLGVGGGAEEMLHLRGVREHRDVRGAAREGGGRGRERARVLGQRPSVDRDAEDAQPAVHEAVHQPGHRGTILLHGREPAPRHAETVHYLQNLPPREGLRDRVRARDAQLAQRSEGFRATRHDPGAREQRARARAGPQRRREGPRADAGQQDDEVDLARFETARELERLGARSEPLLA